MGAAAALLVLLRGADLLALLALLALVGALVFAAVVLPVGRRRGATARVGPKAAGEAKLAAGLPSAGLPSAGLPSAGQAAPAARPIDPASHHAAKGDLAGWAACCLLAALATGIARAGLAASLQAWWAWPIGASPALPPATYLMLSGASLLLLATAWLQRRQPARAVAPAAAALMLQAGFGHAMEAGGIAAVMLGIAAGVHLLAIATWLGGLVPLLIVAARLPAAAARAVGRRFARLAWVAAGILALSGAAPAAWSVGSVPALVGTAYGHILLLKLLSFAGLLALTTRVGNRLAATPASGRPAAASLRPAIIAVAVLGLTTVLAAACLAVLPAGAASQPLWPFPWRLSLDALADADTRGRIALALAAAGTGFALAATGCLWRRRGRLALLAAGFALVLASLPSIRLLAVVAYPTSFYRSPTDFAAASILHGRDVFAANCAICHGVEGRGDGVLAGQLPVRPADLTAAHLWGHRDGELFWWISSGRPAPDGAPAMPPFAATLSAADRWSVIDFVRANNAGHSERVSGAWVVPIAAPAVPVVCAGLAVGTMQDLRGSVVRVVADGDAAAAQHPPAIPPQAGHAVVILHLARAPMSGAISAALPAGDCRAATPDAWNAYAVLSGTPAQALAGTEFLVDPDGWLRAAWTPGSGRGWSTPTQLIAQVRLICSHTIASTTGGDHDHDD
jgi:putative copper export protein/mono/diheme cytochrome c family protein